MLKPDQGKLLNSLIRLGEKVALEVRTLKQSKDNGLEVVAQEFRPAKAVEHRFDQVHFIPDRDNYQRFDYYEWKTDSLIKLDDKIRKSKEHNKALNQVIEQLAPYQAVTNAKKHKAFVKVTLLNQFINFLYKKTVQDDFKVEHLNYYSQVFINDITKGRTIRFHATAHLSNLSIDKEELQLSLDAIIRRTSLKDLAYITRDFYEDELTKMGGKMSNTLSILIVYIDVINDLNVDFFDNIRPLLIKRMEAIINAIRLCHVSNVFESHFSFQTESILYYGFDEQRQSPFTDYLEKPFLPRDGSPYHYVLKETDIPLLSSLLKVLEPIISCITHKSYFEGEPHELAFHRYKDCLLRSKLNINRLAYAVYSLDATFVRNSEYKTKDKLLTRSAFLLAWVTQTAIREIRPVLEIAYGIRSKLVHGGKFTVEEKQFSENQTRVLLNYARQALITFLQLSPQMSKDEFIDKIERSKKDPGKLAGFKKILEKLVIT